MGYFNKIFIQRNTGEFQDITNLNKEEYESFLTAMVMLNKRYYELVDKPLIFKQKIIKFIDTYKIW